MYCDWPLLRRCCFCMPLRRGVLVIAYLNVLLCGYMIGIYSYVVNRSIQVGLVYHGTVVPLPPEAAIVVYIVDMSFNALLIYGAHKKIKKYVKIYYYFAVATILVSVLLFIIELATMSLKLILIIQLFAFGFASLIFQVYLTILAWGLLKKLEEDEHNNVYENQLHQIIHGQAKVETDNPSTIPQQHNAVIV